MSILNRLSNLTKATIHEVLNKLEDPILMTGQYLRNLEEDIATNENLIRDQKTAAKVNEQKSLDASRNAQLQEQKALDALSAGNEEAARRAAVAKIHYQDEAENFAANAKQAESQVFELELRLKEAKEELAQLKEKRKELAERARKVEQSSQAECPNFSQGTYSGAAARGFERMEEKISEWEANISKFGSPFSAETANPDNDPAVSEELQRLKNQLYSDKNK
ncbi:PspA/IM30 family protein [Paenibacillus bouchesdurhonensis]|uniref:PspA/IM30 family protein n=1 Tax=Paenibacillus bouchesdurhonensis TaxID=1870990 RepID=UPI000DA5F255|nr:PspA/IM30 family protein [Paenibacillus bouchesdurhonensis]